MDYINRSLCAILCLISSSIYAQQITIDNTVTVENLVENTLIQGCVEVTNISSPSNGNSIGLGSFGFFEKASSNFPFQNGIVLTTGNANSGGNGQNNTILNEGNASWTTDSDLETALGITGTLNATSIEFNFISISNQIQFNYILASEEYFGNFPCEYSDGFAFLIREAGSGNPYVNIALVPGTSTPVNTNTVHSEIVGFCDASNEAYFQGFNVGDTNYNGRTTVLSAAATIQPNVQYQIKLVIADQTDQNYDSAVFIEGNSFNSNVDLGEDFSTCASDVLLDGNIQNPDATYSWFFNNTLIPSANQTTYNALETGNYRVEIEIPFASGTCIIEDDINLTLSSTQSSEPISDYNLCDDLSNDGFETFNLNTKDAEVLASVPPSNYSFSYHYSNTEATNNSNAITSPIQNTTNPQIIHVRIEDISNGCLAFSTVSLNVNQIPTITNPTRLEVCDDATADGVTAIDLNMLKDDEITNGQTNLVVTYHHTASDAAATINAIPMPYVNANTNEQLFVSVTNPETGCSITTTLDITILDNPVINNTETLYIDACDTDHNGFADFDLTSVTAEILGGLTDVTVTFHETEEDALTGSNPILDDVNYTNIGENEQIVYIRVESNATGCASITNFEIHTNLLLTGTEIRDITKCDEDNDGVEEFNFATIGTTIINDLPDVTVIFYESEEDRDNETNPIDPNQPYVSEGNQTIYIALESATCSDVAEFNLELKPIREFTSIGIIDICDEDQDGLTTIDLSMFDSDVTSGEEGFSIIYFLTEDDAENNTNALPNFYTNVANPFRLYPRISSDASSCSSYNSFEINVLPAPETNTPDEIIICDADRDGLSIVNLNNSSSQVIGSTPNRTITFHNSLEDAELDINPIINASNYEAETETIYIRVENSGTGCHTIEELNIIVNTLPFIGNLSNTIDEYNYCENETDGVGKFVFETKDVEALSGQTGKDVSYYLNQADADNKVNAIDKTTVYENISNPQQIYIRVDNISDESCYMTSSFKIEVGTNPEFNEPVDWFKCDDMSNDGSEFFDLSTKVSEISNGISNIENITFYTSENDAINSINAIPLQFENTVNPQQIYVQIDNGTICKSITSFILNIVQVPQLSEAEAMVACDDDTDGFITFDLTSTESNILDVRQGDIIINYFENFEDSETNSNEILNPETYTNTSNPQTVYMKVTNTVSNCYISLPIDLIVNLPPAINNFVTYDICTNEANTFDLTEINEIAVDDTTNVIFSYFSNEADAIANTNALSTNYTYQTNFDTLFIRTEFSTTNCYSYYEFNLKVNDLPIANQPNNLVACDDDFDGILEFDLTQQNASILGGQNQNAFTITYHNSEVNANEGLSPVDTDYMAFDDEAIFVRIENNSTGCYSTTQFSVIINPLPIIDIEDQVICLDNLPLIVSANTNNPTDVYLWSTGETTPEIEITTIGTYSIRIINEFNCENTRVFDVTESEAASIDVTEIVDFSDPNNITVTISGIGNYLYQLDDFEPQESNVFSNVAMGYHTVTIIDLNGCSNVTKEVLVVDVPKFFTPNSDGAFDTWHIVGIETLPGTIVKIFDRYGKLLKQLRSDSPGWDGRYNGNKLPTSDYWYVADVQRGGISFQLKGHFTLRR